MKTAVTISEPFEAEILAMRPPDSLEIWEHGEKYCLLPKDSAIKGNWLFSMVPYAAMIFEALKRYYSIAIVKSAQSGVSVVMQVIVGYFTHQIPRPIMVVLADQDTSIYVADMRYRHMFEGNVELSRLIDWSTWTQSRMAFVNGGYIEMGWASSVPKMGTRSMGIVILDEIDKPGYSLSTREASAIKLAENRLKTFPDKKLLKLSTPTDELGNITQEIETADIVFDWHAPCPYCGQFQPLNWWYPASKNFWFPEGKYRGEDGEMHELGSVVWEGGARAANQQILETVRYLCGECGAAWTSQEKNEAVKKGKCVPRTEPTGFEIRAGICITELLSLFDSGRLENMVAEWVSIFRIKNREERDRALQDFVNSKLAEPFKQVVLSISEAAVLSAKCDLPPQVVPESAVALVCGVDVQKYGFWFVIRAFAQDFTSWLIHYGYLSTAEELEDLLFRTRFPQENNQNEIGIWRAALDTGGGEGDEEYDATMTERTYLWLARNRRRGVHLFPTKGSSHAMPGRILQYGAKVEKLANGQALPGALQLILLNTTELKNKFRQRLDYAIESNESGTVIPGAAFLHSGTDHLYASHIMAERKERVKGVQRWVKVKPRNDLFDAEVLCQALANPEWPGMGVDRLNSPRHTPKEPEPPPEAPIQMQRAAAPVIAKPSPGQHSILGDRIVNPRFNPKSRRLM